MVRKHLYLAIEDIALSAGQRAALVDKMKALGPVSDPQPARLNHWRISLDGSKAIFEANFQEEVLTVDAMKVRLGDIFSVDPATIDHSTITRQFVVRNTPIVTFSRTGTDYLRMALFGGPATTWSESRIETLGYLAENQDAWMSEEEMAEAAEAVSFPTRVTTTYRTVVGSLRNTVGDALVRLGEWVRG